jgi:hypothetical protein
MVNQELLFTKPSKIETKVICVSSESIDGAECDMYIGALSPEEFDRLKQNYQPDALDEILTGKIEVIWDRKPSLQ